MSQSRRRGAISNSGHVNRLPMDIDDPKLEELILQYLVVATSIGRAHHMVQSNQLSALSSGSALMPATAQGISIGDRSLSSSSLTPSEGRARPSEFHSLSESLKSRFSSLSMKYKESISKNTREWKERFFSRSSSMPDAGSARREANSGIVGLSHLMERLKTRENSRADSVLIVTTIVDSSHTL
ncbi:E3 ubiquitin-protein ligase RHF2A [Capsicum chinense]|nr:E3 ubiquitin-protein ligase RHF2A [Capsicum chinense]